MAVEAVAPTAVVDTGKASTAAKHPKACSSEQAFVSMN